MKLHPRQAALPRRGAEPGQRIGRAADGCPDWETAAVVVLQNIRSR